MKNRNHPGAFERRVAALHKGFKEALPGSQEQLMVAGTMVTMAGVHQRLASILKTQRDVAEAKRIHQNAVLARRMAEASDHAFVEGVVGHLRARLGESYERLAPFGLEPPKKRRAPSMVTRVIAQAKARETRRLRQAQAAQPMVVVSEPSKP